MSAPVLVPPLTRALERRRPVRAGLGSPAAAAVAPLALVPAVAVPAAAAAVPGVGLPAVAPVVRRPRHRVARLAAAAVAALGLVAVGGTLAVAADVVLAAQEDARTPSDAIVVLGAAQFWGDPSPVLRARLEHAMDLRAAGVAPVIVTVGAGRPDDPTAEADAARSWLLARGVPADAVLSVPAGSDTVRSLRSVARVVDDLGWSSVTVVSDPAHAARASAVASALDLPAALSPTHDGPGSMLTAEYVARETAALVRFHLIGRWSVAARTP